MTIQQYTESLNRRFKKGNATEPKFRGDLQQLPVSLSESARLMLEINRIEIE